jgi:hypothetical protein
MGNRLSSKAKLEPPPGGKDVINQTFKAPDSSKVTNTAAERT